MVSDVTGYSTGAVVTSSEPSVEPNITIADSAASTQTSHLAANHGKAARQRNTTVDQTSSQSINQNDQKMPLDSHLNYMPVTAQPSSVPVETPTSAVHAFGYKTISIDEPTNKDSKDNNKEICDDAPTSKITESMIPKLSCLSFVGQ